MIHRRPFLPHLPARKARGSFPSPMAQRTPGHTLTWRRAHRTWKFPSNCYNFSKPGRDFLSSHYHSSLSSLMIVTEAKQKISLDWFITISFQQQHSRLPQESWKQHLCKEHQPFKAASSHWRAQNFACMNFYFTNYKLSHLVVTVETGLT